jgi:hypothetical protein
MSEKTVTRVIGGKNPTALRTVRVNWNQDWEEYICRLYVNGKENKRAAYHTHDRADAMATAARMVQA